MNSIFILSIFIALFVFYAFLYKRTPLFILPIIYMTVGIYTVLGESFFDFSKNVPFDFYNKIDGESVRYIYYHLMAGSFFYTMGFFLFFKKRSTSVLMKLDLNTTIKDKHIYFVFLITIILLHVGYGVEHLYYREGYTLGDAGVSFARVLYTLCLPLTCLLIPFSKNTLISLFFSVVLFVLVMGTSSRNLVLIPACIFLGGVIKNGRVSFLKSLLYGILVVFSVTISIQSRNHAIQGVWPNILSLFDSGFDLLVMSYAINYLTSYSIFASSLAYQNYSPDLLSLYYSVTPLPSSAIDVKYMIESQKLNANSPIPALGLLALNGPLVFCTYYFISGSVLAIFGGFLAKINKPLNIFVVMFILVFSFLSLQYNLRGTTRVLYYLIFISLSVKVLNVIKFNIRS